MFIYHVKVNGSKLFKTFFIAILLLILVIVSIVSFQVFHGAYQSNKDSSCMPPNDVSKLSATNYTNVLKTVHENIDDYVGLKINFTGYIYRVFDLSENQFILARDMVISSDFQTLVVGFLCEWEKAKDFENETWVELTGEITKGNYHGDMPILKVTDMKRIAKPNEEFVYPPDETYIPTSNLLG